MSFWRIFGALLFLHDSLLTGSFSFIKALGSLVLLVSCLTFSFLLLSLVLLSDTLFYILDVQLRDIYTQCTHIIYACLCCVNSCWHSMNCLLNYLHCYQVNHHPPTCGLEKDMAPQKVQLQTICPIFLMHPVTPKWHNHVSRMLKVGMIQIDWWWSGSWEWAVTVTNRPEVSNTIKFCWTWSHPYITICKWLDSGGSERCCGCMYLRQWYITTTFDSSEPY